MGWSLSQYKEATLYELNMSSRGYWKRWERNTAWLAREVMHMMISLSPDVKSSKKPDKLDMMPLSIDKKPIKDDNIDVVKAAKEYENRLKNEI
jgi:hypothetical protein